MKNTNTEKQMAALIEALSKVGSKLSKAKAAIVVESLQESGMLRTGPDTAPPLNVDTLLGPVDGDLYEGLVTVDTTESARIVVRAHSMEEAEGLFLEAAHKQYPVGFSVDEGNYKKPDQFYLPDPEAFEKLNNVTFESEYNFYGRADWRDLYYVYSVHASRDEPDNSDEDAQGQVTVTLKLTLFSDQSKVVTKELGSEVHEDNLGDWLREALAAGDYRDYFDEMKEELNG